MKMIITRLFTFISVRVKLKILAHLLTMLRLCCSRLTVEPLAWGHFVQKNFGSVFTWFSGSLITGKILN